MARIRTIKPEFWGHTKVARVSRDARLLFLGLLNEADDDGKLLGSTKRLAGVVFPYDDDVTPKRITKWLDELESVCLILRYEVGGSPYILLPGFTDHQKISHPTASRLPNPSGEILEGLVPEGKGKEGKGEEGTAAPHLCPDPFEIDDDLRKWGVEKTSLVDLDGLALEMVFWSRSTGKRRASWRKTLQSWATTRQKELAEKQPRGGELAW